MTDVLQEPNRRFGRKADLPYLYTLLTQKVGCLHANSLILFESTGVPCYTSELRS